MNFGELRILKSTAIIVAALMIIAGIFAFALMPADSAHAEVSSPVASNPSVVNPEGARITKDLKYANPSLYKDYNVTQGYTSFTAGQYDASNVRTGIPHVPMNRTESNHQYTYMGHTGSISTAGVAGGGLIIPNISTRSEMEDIINISGDAIVITSPPTGTNNDPSDFTFTFSMSTELRKALKDNMLVVTMTPYVVVAGGSSIISQLNGANREDAENCTLYSLVYNGGVDEEGVSAAIRNASSRSGIDLRIDNSDRLVYGANQVIATGNYAEGAFMQVTLCNFKTVGSAFTVAIREVGVRLYVTYNSNLNIATLPSTGLPSSNPDDFNQVTTCIVQGVNRYSSALPNCAKRGDTLDINLILKNGSTKMTLDTATYSSISQINSLSIESVKDGTMFRRFFLSVSDTIMTWDIIDGTVEGTGELNGTNKSGQAIKYTVESGGPDSGLLLLQPSIAYKPILTKSIASDGTHSYTYETNTRKITNSKVAISITVDAFAPNMPTLLTSGTGSEYYSKYLNEDYENYYTTIQSSIQEGDKIGNDVVKLLVTGSTNRTRPTFTAATLDNLGGSDALIYYRTVYVGDEIPIGTAEKHAQPFSGPIYKATDDDLSGFDLYEGKLLATEKYYKLSYYRPEGTNVPSGQTIYYRNNYGKYVKYTQSTFTSGLNYVTAEPYNYETSGEFAGLYARVSGNDNDMDCTYGNIYVNMIIGKGAGGANIITKSGVWAIEFVTYDYTGQTTLCSDRYYIRVDITDYEFLVQFSIGGDFTQTEIQKDHVKVYCMILDDDGRYSSPEEFDESADGNSMAFNFLRSNKVALRIRIDDTATYNGFTLTNCTIGTNPFDTGSLSYTSRQANLNFTFMSVGTTKAYYTFEVDESFCVNETTRRIMFTFKRTVAIAVSNTEQYYSGVSKQVTTTVPVLQALGMQANVTTKYYYRNTFLDEDLVIAGENGANWPINAGTYYYRAELKDHNTYYGNKTGEFVILKASPSLSSVSSNGINYGDSFAKIDFNPNNMVNDVQVPNNGIYAYFSDPRSGREYFVEKISSDHVVGYYQITEIFTSSGTRITDKTSSFYTKPNAGEVRITVKFTPVKGQFISYNEINYDYDGNGLLQRDENYDVVSTEIIVTVSHDNRVRYALLPQQEGSAGRVKETTMETNTSPQVLKYVEYTYNGSSRMLYFTIESSYEADPYVTGQLLDLLPYTRVYYTKVDGVTLTQRELAALQYSDIAPSNSGIYAVKIMLDEARCNYSFTTYSYIVINKVSLAVSIAQRDATFEYQQDSKPLLSVKLGNADYLSVVKGYIYEYFYYDQNEINAEAMATEENRVPANKLRTLTGTPFNAGEYCLKVSVNDPNYEGVGYVKYTVKKVDSDNLRLNKSWPMVSGSPIDPAYSLLYGQPLAQIGIGTNYTFTYPYVNYRTATASTTTIMPLDGEVFIATEKYEDWLQRMYEEQTASSSTPISYDEYMQAMFEEYCQRMAFDATRENYWYFEESNRLEYIAYMERVEPQYSQNPYSWYLVFVARPTGMTTSGHDIDLDIDFIYTNVEIRVGKAEVEWRFVEALPVTYGDTITSVGFIGKPVSLRLSKTLGVLYSVNGMEPLDGDFYTYNRYVFRYAQADYTYAFTENIPTASSAGTVNITLQAIFDDPNFNSVYVGGLEMTVLKKEVGVSVSTQVKKSYKAFADTDLYAYLEYTESDFVGAKPVGLGGTFEVSKDGIVVPFDSISVGVYDVKFTLNHTNYRAETVFSLKVEPSVLTLSGGETPELAAPSVNIVYDAKVKTSVTLLGGSFIAKGGEALTNLQGEVKIGANMGIYRRTPQGEVIELTSVTDALRFEKAGTKVRIYFDFFPNDSTNYESFRGTDENGGYVDIAVDKANIGESMHLEMRAPRYIYKDITFGKASFKDELNYTVSSEYASLAWDYTIVNERDEVPVEGKFVNAGTYTVTLSVADDNYTGSTTCTLVMEKKSAFIALRETNGTIIEENGKSGLQRTFRGSSLTIEYYVYEIDGGVQSTVDEVATVTYYREGIRLTSNPSKIGYYDVTMTLSNSTNYALCSPATGDRVSRFDTFLKIAVDKSSIEIINYDQVYTIQKIVTVFMGTNDAVCTLSYEKGGVQYKELPIDAGEYDIYLNFDPSENNGYYDKINAADLTDETGAKRGYKLIIEKYQTQITAPATVTCTYTGLPAEKFSPYTSPYGLDLSYFYKRQDATEYTATTLADLGALDAGMYDVRMEIANSNYYGEKEIVFWVNKARIAIKTLPEFGTYEYNSTQGPICVEEGSAVFGSVNVDGEFYIPLRNINTLSVGEHEVEFVFTPSSDNYLDATGEVIIVVVKQKLPDDFIKLGADGTALVDGDYSVEYNGSTQTLKVGFDRTKIYNYPAENSDFSVNLRFYIDGEEKTPMQLGHYTVTAEIVSKNYECTKTWTAHKFIITTGTPVIKSVPKPIKTFVLGEQVSDTDFIGGKAVSSSSDDKEIRGTFSLSGGSAILNAANTVRLTMTFYPADSDNYKIVNDIKVEVSVVGKDPVKIDGVVAATGTTASNGAMLGKVFFPDFKAVGDEVIHEAHDGCGAVIVIRPKNNNIAALEYGAEVNEYYIGFEPADPDCETCYRATRYLANNGTLGFENLNDVPDVGSMLYISYKVAPSLVEESSKLNYVYGYCSTDGVLLRRNLSERNYYCEVIKFGGEDGYVVIVKNKDGSEFGNITVRGGTAVYAGAFAGSAAANSAVSVNFNGNRATISGYTSNYTLPASTIDVLNYTYIDADDIVVERTEKPYDGIPISVSDLGVSVKNNHLPVFADEYHVIVYDAAGKVTDGIAMGAYTVQIYIEGNNSGYYGQKEIVFTVTRRNVSNELALAKPKENGEYYDIYGSGSHTDFDVEIDGTEIPSMQCKVEVKREDADDGDYTESIGSLPAGRYNVRVTVDHQNYVGEKVFTYIVRPQPITMKLDRNEFTVEYGSSAHATFAVTPSFEDADRNMFTFEDKGGYTVYYYSAENNYPKQTDKPQNAGRYTVTVESNVANYEIVSNVVSYVIDRKRTVVAVAPMIGSVDADGNHLIYGQPLSSLSIISASDAVTDTSGNIVPGEFTVADEDADTVLGATIGGNVKITLVFKPTNRNYANCYSDVNIKVGQKTVKIELTNTSAAYNGRSQKDKLTYKELTENISLEFEFRNAADQVVDPTDVGVYTVRVISAVNNYNIVMSTPDGTENSAPYFTVTKAQVIKTRIVDPKAGTIGVGESLMKSSLSGAIMYYEGFDRPIEGSCSYIEEGRVFTTAGEKVVEYLFTPKSSANFATYKGTVTINIGRGIAKLTIGVNEIEYGTPADFLHLNITTDPSGLAGAMRYDFTYEGRHYQSGDIMPAGTYWFTCWVDGENYVSEPEKFSYVVNRKQIDIDFVDEIGNVVTAYTVAYGQEAFRGVKVYDSNNTSGKKTYLLSDAAHILDNIEYYYVSRGETNEYKGYNPPAAIGTYDMTVTLRHDNYTATKTVIYRVTSGRVTDVSFDVDSLLNQQYGAVTPPIVTTTPANVSYYIIYQGYNTTLPTAVGSYNITVYIHDDNYASYQTSAVFKINPRPLSVGDLFVYDKAYDGVSTLNITGSLVGVRYGDEVELTLAARTYNGDASVGSHYVEITKCELSGLHASGYTLEYPTYDGKVTIFQNLIKDSGKGSSYISSSNGFADGTTVTFAPVNTPRNKTTVWSRMLGVEAAVTSYQISVNNTDGINANQYKVCVEIPEKFRGKDFKVSFDGELKDLPISATVEGNYVSFYSTVASGEVIFESAEFKYEYVVIAAILIIVLIALAVLLLVNPLMHRRTVGDPAKEKAAVRKIKGKKVK